MIRGGNRKIAELLLLKGADVNTSGGAYSNGQKPLMNAVLSGNKEIIELLIKNGADVNAKNKFGYTALMSAVMVGSSRLGGDCEIIKLLISSGADVNARQNNGETALALIEGFKSRLPNYPNADKIISLLKAHGATK